jgi:hypothetical protein
VSDDDDLGIALALRADAEHVTYEQALPWLMGGLAIAALIALVVVWLCFWNRWPE